MLDNWIKIGKRRKKLINKIIALDSSRSLEQLSKWTVRNLEREIFLLEKFPSYAKRKRNDDEPRAEGQPTASPADTAFDDKFNERIERLRNHAKANDIWDENPKKGKWL